MVQEIGPEKVPLLKSPRSLSRRGGAWIRRVRSTNRSCKKNTQGRNLLDHAFSSPGRLGKGAGGGVKDSRKAEKGKEKGLREKKRGPISRTDFHVQQSKGKGGRRPMGVVPLGHAGKREEGFPQGPKQ